MNNLLITISAAAVIATSHMTIVKAEEIQRDESPKVSGNIAADRPPLTLPAGDPILIANVELACYMKPTIDNYGLGGENAKETPVAHLIVRLTSERGISGMAERTLRKSPIPEESELAAARERLLGVLKGRDARQAESLFDKLTDYQAIVDIALWDMIGRSEGKPIHELLGTRRQSVPAYYSKGSLKDFEVARKAVGYKAWKIHYWPEGNAAYPLFPASVAVANFEELRKALGPDVKLIADCHFHYAKSADLWTLDDVATVARGLQEQGFFWIEGLPMVFERPDVYARIRQSAPRLKVQHEFPGVLGGNIMDIYAKVFAYNAEQTRVFDVLANQTTLEYGFSRGIQMARWAIANKKVFDIHWPCSIDMHIAAAMTDGQYPYFETGSYPFHRDVQIKNGMVEAPRTPGLCDIRVPVGNGKTKPVDWNYVKSHAAKPTPATGMKGK